LSAINIPFLALHALDDPMCRDKYIPYDYFLKKKNKNIIFARTEKGGHIA